LLCYLWIFGVSQTKNFKPLLKGKCKQIIVNHFFSERDFELEIWESDKNNNLLFILNEGGNHSRIFYLEEFLVLLLHVYRHENSLIYFCLQLFFISSTFLLPAIWQNQSVSSSHFQRRGGTGFKSPNVSRENPLEPRLQNSIWHTNCVYVSARIIFFWSYLTFEIGNSAWHCWNSHQFSQFNFMI